MTRGRMLAVFAVATAVAVAALLLLRRSALFYVGPDDGSRFLVVLDTASDVLRRDSADAATGPPRPPKGRPVATRVFPGAPGSF